MSAPPSAPPLKVLLVEDNPADVRLVRELLREWGPIRVVLTHAEGLRQAVTMLQKEGFNAILLDLSLPDSQGLETFTRAHAEAPTAPIVVLTGLRDEEMAVRAVREGAQDYLVKGQVDGHGLYQAIRYAIERQRGDDALRESEQRFRELAENVREVFFIVDPETGRSLYLSPAYDDVFGHSREHAYAAPNAWLDTVHPEDRGRMLEALFASARGERDNEDAYRVVRPDGSIRWIRGRASPVRDATGRTIRLVGIAEDITELRRTQDQLFRAQKMEAVGRLAGGVAHDFNNLLTAITGHAELVREDLREGDRLREDIEEILNAANRAAVLTKQLLAFSRRQVLAPRVVDLNALVANMDKMLRRLIGEDIDLRTVLGEDLGAVRADPGQLEQVLVNLAVNARDAMPQGGRLTLETGNVELDDAYVHAHEPVRPGPYVMLAVSDTGTGMTEEVQARIFEPFFTTKEAGKGTGLGLATVYGIVKQSGGYVWVYSEVGRGSAFKVYLPQVDEAPEALTARAPAVGTAGGTETILVVEDEAMVRSLARISLGKRGYRVLEAANGGEALQLTEQHTDPIHLMVTDLVMPGMSGQELAERLARLRPGMKVLYISGYTDRALMRESVLPPGAAYLEKPFTPDALARKVRAVLDGK